MSMTQPHNPIIDEGYALIPNVLSPAFIQELRDDTNMLLDRMTVDDQAAQRSTGSMIPAVKSLKVGELIVHPALHDAMERVGFTDWRFSSGYIISKPTSSPPLFWHYDWAAWNHPFSYEPMPAQIFAMVYLVDTNPGNGCLRVIPRSHIEEHPLHELIGKSHSDQLKRAGNLSSVEYQPHLDEVDISVKAGDVVIGDSRILHGAHANNSDERRTLITLWFHPNYTDLPDPIKGYVASLYSDETEQLVETWPPELLARFKRLKPKYHGDAEPLEFSRDRLSREAFFGVQRSARS